MLSADSLILFRKLLQKPAQIGSVVPSSARLCKKMAQNISADTGLVVELGPGTGVLTGHILKKGVSPENLKLVELDSDFCKMLRQRYPEIQVEQTGAQNLGDLDLPKAGAILSSLPMLAFPASLQREIVAAIVDGLHPEGVYMQFTYGNSCPINTQIANEFGLGFKNRGRVWENIPPARIYEYRRVRH